MKKCALCFSSLHIQKRFKSQKQPAKMLSLIKYSLLIRCSHHNAV